MFMSRRQHAKHIPRYWIYILYDPRKPEVIRYVGMANNPQSRFDQHFNFPSNWMMREWMQDLKLAGCYPEYQVLQEGPYTIAGARKRELHWITRYLRLGHPLLNVSGTKKKKEKRVELIIPFTAEEYATIARRCQGLGKSPAELVRELFFTVS